LQPGAGHEEEPLRTVDPDDILLTPTQVALRFRVNPKTIARWAKEGRLPHIKTLGGHRRYPQKWMQELFDDAAREIGRKAGG
jgi:excisionase family DNA binding protein